MKKLYFLFSTLASVFATAQCPIITMPASASIGCNTPTLITATGSYSLNVVTRWMGPGNVPLAATPGATTSVLLNAPGTYTVYFTDTGLNCTVSETIAVSSAGNVNPIFDLSSPDNFTMTCPNQPVSININNAQTNPIPGGPVSYTMVALPGTPGPGILSSVSVYTPPSCGDYEIFVRDNISSCESSFRVRVDCAPNPLPTVTIVGDSLLCAGDVSTLTAYGAQNYTWNLGVAGPSVVVSPSVSFCYSVIGQSAAGCTVMASHCVSVTPWAQLNVAVSGTVCRGTSATLSVSGANSYTWSNSSNNATISVIPNFTSTYTVTGTLNNGCFGWGSGIVGVDTTCSDVWPGDASSDGIVNNLDVFEIGLAFNNTGAARNPGGNNYTAQFASNWPGLFISNFKNQCHADCDGNGTINMADTIAIFNNFSMAHSFKTAQQTAAGGDITIVTTPGGAVPGTWVKADVEAGNNTSPLSQVYGLSFDIDYDAALFDGVYLKYVSSFLNANTQNVEFRKNDLPSGMLYAASVRTDQGNVNGAGKIAEFWFRVKPGTAENTPLNFSVLNPVQVSANASQSALTGGTAQTYVTYNAAGLNQNADLNKLEVFPNPSSGSLVIPLPVSIQMNFRISDVLGKEVLSGSVNGSTPLDISALKNGTYFISLSNEENTSTKKFVLLR